MAEAKRVYIISTKIVKIQIISLLICILLVQKSRFVNRLVSESYKRFEAF